MKKTLVILFISMISIVAYGQDYTKDRDYYYYDGVENRQDMGISSEQKSKIIAIKKGIGRRHAAIGKDRSLRGYEKGEAHRNLNKQVRKEIYAVLNGGQRDDWDKEQLKSESKDYKKWNKRVDAIEDEIDKLEDKIDDLEDYYEDRIDDVENDRSLSKSEMKAQKRALKDELKTKKEQMKREKQVLKDSRYISE